MRNPGRRETGQQFLHELRARAVEVCSSGREHLAHGPYLFADLPGTSPEEEQTAIDEGRIRAMRVDYAATLT